MSAAPKLRDRPVAEPTWRQPPATPASARRRRPAPAPTRNERRQPAFWRSTLFWVLVVVAGLLVYVFLSAATLRGGYYSTELGKELDQVRQQNELLEARIRELKAPKRVLSLAPRIGMHPAPAEQVLPLPPGESTQ